MAYDEPPVSGSGANAKNVKKRSKLLRSQLDRTSLAEKGYLGSLDRAEYEGIALQRYGDRGLILSAIWHGRRLQLKGYSFPSYVHSFLQ